MEFTDITYEDGHPSGWRAKQWALPEGHCDALMKMLAPNSDGVSPCGVVWAPGELHIHGKDCLTPRLTTMVATDPRIKYKFSGGEKPSQAMPAYIADIMRYVNTLVRESYPDAPEFNTVYMNWYRDGNDNIGYHHDREEGKMPYVVSLTVHYARTGGDQLRRFVIREQTGQERTAETYVNNGTLVVATPAANAATKHQVPPTKKVTAPRLNLTFRRLTPKIN